MNLIIHLNFEKRIRMSGATFSIHHGTSCCGAQLLKHKDNVTFTSYLLKKVG
jgi:hypothetical protein